MNNEAESQILDFLRGCINDRDKMLEQLMKDSQQCVTIMNGTRSVLQSVDNCSETTVRKLLKTNMKATAQLADMNCRLITLMILYTGSPDFSSTAAKLMVSMGHGEEALKSMFKQKMGK